MEVDAVLDLQNFGQFQQGVISDRIGQSHRRHQSAR